MGIHYSEHPLCRHLPKMDDDDLQKLADDIEKNGQRLPIILFRGQILDGRHRRNACILRGVEPQYETFAGTFQQAKDLVRSLNEHRRHMTTSQRALAAAGWDDVKDDDQNEDGVAIATAAVQEEQTATDAADAWKVNRATVFRAKKVLKSAADEVTDEIKQGRMTIHKAGKLAAAVPDKAEQAEIVRAGRVDEVLKKALPPEEPPALPKTNTLHSPATQQRIDRGSEPAPPQIVEPVAGMTTLATIIAQHTIAEILEELVAGYEGDQAKRVAKQLRQFADKLDPLEETKAPTLAQMRSIIDERAKLPPADDRHLKPIVATAASEWAAHKISMPKAKRYQSRTSWEACLSRMATLSLDRGADVVCDMIQRAIASGYQGWELEASAPRGGRPASRNTNIRTGRNFDAEMGPPINLSDVEEF